VTWERGRVVREAARGGGLGLGLGLGLGVDGGVAQSWG
jgi:hypothetical protein